MWLHPVNHRSKGSNEFSSSISQVMWQAFIHFYRHGIQERYFPSPRLTPFHSNRGIVYGKSQLYPRAVCGYTCISSNLIPAKCLKCQIFISPKFLLIQYIIRIFHCNWIDMQICFFNCLKCCVTSWTQKCSTQYTLYSNVRSMWQ